MAKHGNNTPQISTKEKERKVSNGDSAVKVISTATTQIDISDMLDTFKQTEPENTDARVITPLTIEDKYAKLMSKDYSSLNTAKNLYHPLGSKYSIKGGSDLFNLDEKVHPFDIGDGLRTHVYKHNIKTFVKYKFSSKPKYYKLDKGLSNNSLLQVLEYTLEKLTFNDINYIISRAFIKPDALSNILMKITKNKVILGKTRWQQGYAYTWDDLYKSIQAELKDDEYIKDNERSNDFFLVTSIITKLELDRFFRCLNLTDKIYVSDYFMDKDFADEHKHSTAKENFLSTYAKDFSSNLLLKYANTIIKSPKYDEKDGLVEFSLVQAEIYQSRRLVIDETLLTMNAGSFFDMYELLLATKVFKLTNNITIESPELLNHTVVTTLGSVADFSLPTLLNEDRLIEIRLMMFSPEQIERGLNRLTDILTQSKNIELASISEYKKCISGEALTNKLGELQSVVLYKSFEVQGSFKDYIVIGDYKEKANTELFIRPGIHNNVSAEINALMDSCLSTFSHAKVSSAVTDAVKTSYDVCGFVDIQNLSGQIVYQNLNTVEISAIAIDNGEITITADTDVASVISNIPTQDDYSIKGYRKAAVPSITDTPDIEMGVALTWGYMHNARRFVKAVASVSSTFALAYYDLPLSEYVHTNDAAFYIAQKLHAEKKRLDAEPSTIYNDAVDYDFKIFDNVILDNKFSLAHNLDFVSFFKLSSYKLEEKDKAFFLSRIDGLDKEIDKINADESLSNEAKESAVQIINSIKNNVREKVEQCEKDNQWLVNIEVPLSLITPFQVNTLLNSTFFRRKRFKQLLDRNIQNVLDGISTIVTNMKRYNKNISEDAMLLEHYKNLTGMFGSVIQSSPMLKRWISTLVAEIEREINLSTDLYMHPFITHERRTLINIVAANVLIYVMLLLDIIDSGTVNKILRAFKWMIENHPQIDVFGLSETSNVN